MITLLTGLSLPWWSHGCTRRARGRVVLLPRNYDNEHSMDGDHAKEKLVNWLMSKNSVATCFIKDVLSMSEIEGRGGTHFRLSTRIPTHIRLDKQQAFHIISSDAYRADQSP
jgi:hypothetical protein